MSRRIGTFVTVIVLAAAIGALVVAGVDGPPLPVTIQERILAVAETLRCPVCQDLSVADSPSQLAGQMRAKIATELLAGMSPDAIRAGFVRSYGTWILLSPPSRGAGVLLRLAPFLVLIFGACAVAWLVRRWRRGRGGSAAPDAAIDELEAEDRELLASATTEFLGEGL